VLAVAQRELVERQRWLTREQFVEMLSVGQVLPGPNVMNLSLMLGDRFFGWRGAFAALAGMTLVPLVVVIALAALYTQFAAVPWVAGALRGMGAVSAGLVIATALKLMGSLKTNAMGRWLCAAFTLLTIAGVTVLHVPLVWIVLGLGSTAVAAAWWKLSRSQSR
jgi:chromate transporter